MSVLFLGRLGTLLGPQFMDRLNDPCKAGPQFRSTVLLKWLEVYNVVFYVFVMKSLFSKLYFCLMTVLCQFFLHT